MRIMVASNIMGDMSYFDNQIDSADCDCVVTLGTFGIHYNDSRDNYLWDNRYPKMNHRVRDYFKRKRSNFNKYIGRTQFSKPVYYVPAFGDNGNYCSEIQRDDLITNFKIMKNGIIYTIEKDGYQVRLVGLGGRFNYRSISNQHKQRYNYYTVEDIDRLLQFNGKIDFLFLGDPIGGKKRGMVDFRSEINNRYYDFLDICHKYELRAVFWNDINAENDVFDFTAIDHTFTMVFCKNMHEQCYVYDINKDEVVYV